MKIPGTPRLVHDCDAVVVGSGPNGLAAAITLAQVGQRVLVIEAKNTIGGGTRTMELTLPGFLHDVCSAIHPLGVASPFFRGLPLARFGLEWIFPPAALAHPLDDGTAVMLEGSVETTSANLGPDAGAYRRLMSPLVLNYQSLLEDLLGPLPLRPRHPLLDARFGALSLLPAATLAKLFFKGERARAIFCGMAAHSMLPLEAPVTSSFGLMLGLLAHAVGWPMAKGGSQRITGAMSAYLASLGGRVETGRLVEEWQQLPETQHVFFDLAPRQVLQIAGDRLPDGYRRELLKFRYGPGVFKLDYALDSPVPWKAQECKRAATVHIGGTMEEILASERAVWQGQVEERPFVLVVQHTPFDPTRAPQGKHTLWAYCHVPHGSSIDMSVLVENQIERFAPGFKNRILARHSFTPAQMQAYNPNYIGGDINAGVQDLFQFFTRPVLRLEPYSTPLEGVYLCSSSTPPGGGVHGMCGYQAAKVALRRRKQH